MNLLMLAQVQPNPIGELVAFIVFAVFAAPLLALIVRLWYAIWSEVSATIFPEPIYYAQYPIYYAQNQLTQQPAQQTVIQPTPPPVFQVTQQPQQITRTRDLIEDDMTEVRGRLLLLEEELATIMQQGNGTKKRKG